MVMSKVSKAIAASFLCLTINAGGATNAMDAMEQTRMEQTSNKIKENSINTFASKKREVIKNNEFDYKENEQDENDNDDKNKDKAPDGEKSIWRWLLPVITGVGGTAIGICLGKFVF